MMLRLSVTFVAIASGLLLWAVTAFVMVAAILGDCSVDGIRTSPWIDDVDRTSGCLSDAARSTGYVLAPLLALAISIVTVWHWPKVDRVLRNRPR